MVNIELAHNFLEAYLLCNTITCSDCYRKYGVEDCPTHLYKVHGDNLLAVLSNIKNGKYDKAVIDEDDLAKFIMEEMS